jgi:CubicO group peptidase (beta-lactamase class C family)
MQICDPGKVTRRHPHAMGWMAPMLRVPVVELKPPMLQKGRWNDQQIIPQWFVDETAAPTHNVTTPELRWKLNPRIFTHGWELPSFLTGAGGRSGDGIPADARAKPGSGGQYIAFVPSLGLVITRQTGSSGDWNYEEFLRRAARLSRKTVSGTSPGIHDC